MKGVVEGASDSPDQIEARRGQPRKPQGKGFVEKVIVGLEASGMTVSTKVARS